MVQFRTEKITVLNYFSLWLRLKLVSISTSKTLQKSFWKYLIKLNPDIFLISKYFLKSIFNFQPADPVYMGIFGHVASASSWKENEAKESESGSWRNDANKSRTTTRTSTQKESQLSERTPQKDYAWWNWPRGDTFWWRKRVNATSKERACKILDHSVLCSFSSGRPAEWSL